jgi:hypothetical protein
MADWEPDRTSLMFADMLCVRDADGDGLNEIVVSGNSSAVHFWRYNSQYDQYELVWSSPKFGGFTQSVNVADMDRHGTNETMVGISKHIGDQLRGELFIFRFMNDSMEELYGKELQSPIGMSVIGSGDSDNDGYDEFVCHRGIVGTYVYDWTPSGTIVEQSLPEADPFVSLPVVGIFYPHGEVPVMHVEETGRIPLESSLSQNYPNPFNPITTITYDLAKSSNVTLILYTITGQQVQVLSDSYQQAGHHMVHFDGSSLATGVYLYRLEARDFVQTRRMLFLK